MNAKLCGATLVCLIGAALPGTSAASDLRGEDGIEVHQGGPRSVRAMPTITRAGEPPCCANNLKQIGLATHNYQNPGKGATIQQSAGSTPSVSEITVTKLIDVTSSPGPSVRDRLQGGAVPKADELIPWDFLTTRLGEAATGRSLAHDKPAPLPQNPMGGGHGAGKVSFNDPNFLHTTPQAAAPALAGIRPTSPSLNYPKLEMERKEIAKPMTIAPAVSGFRR